MGQVRPRSVGQEQVREPADRDPEVRRRALPPQLGQHDPVAADDLHRPQRPRVVEAGRPDDHVAGVAFAVDGDDGVGLDVVDPGADQLDVVAGEGAQPGAVVLQGALAGGGVVGHHLGDQVGVVADLADDPVGEDRPGAVADLAHRPLLVGEVGVDPRRLQPLVAAGPEQQEPVPTSVERQVPQCPLHAGADLLVVVRVGEHPLGAALEDGQVLDPFADRGGDLEPRRPGADHGDPLAGQLDGVVPAGGVELRAGEVLSSGDVGDLRSVELTDGGDHRPGGQGLGVADRVPVVVDRLGDHRPGRARLVPGRRDHLGAEPDVGLDPVLLHDPLEVGLELGLLGEELGPAVARLEAEAVEVVADVDPGAGVAVLPPRPADTGVLLDDRERDARLLQPDPGEQSGLPAADDHHRELGPGVRGRPGGRSGTVVVASVEL